MGIDDVRNAGLVLGLGLSSSPSVTPRSELHRPIKAADAGVVVEPNLTLALSGESFTVAPPKKAEVIILPRNKAVYGGGACEDISARDGPAESNGGGGGRQASPHSTVSSFSSPRVKRERDLSSEEEEAERAIPPKPAATGDEEDVDGISPRKKLRLTKEQSALLEESFKQHSTLNPKQKQALARQLNLRPRQVEVWFQNRRARTKLKQTEVDCEILKKCCESLTDENRRLQKELQELKAMKLQGQSPAAAALYMHVPAATLTMCPSCERERERVCGGGGDVSGSSARSPFSMAPKAHHHLYNPFNTTRLPPAESTY
ncbi:hypothetical protein SAY86_005295 [Trapa natans]|uniref:Homeobox domain-containing protein n=1 Tax=Trapa natans TaxID=22666 RepID=A0AAN7KZR5_TRANT|nr:hypothetical protein SAY86_005295 [Trapa natans]